MNVEKKQIAIVAVLLTLAGILGIQFTNQSYQEIAQTSDVPSTVQATNNIETEADTPATKQESKRAYCIDVNGQTIARLETLDQAETVLTQVRNQYVENPEKVLSYTYTEQVDVIYREVGSTRIQTVEQAVNYILAGSEELETYTVAKGDTIWGIAQERGVSVQSIVKANPEVDVNRLQIGQVLNLNIPVAMINVETVEEKTFEDNIPYQVVYENSEDLYIGERKTRFSGAYGIKETTMQVTRRNGVIVEQEVIGEEVIKEPENAIIVAGTAIEPGSVASAFTNPADGPLTSRFGTRWGRQHTGIDIGTPTGTPIMAAMDGTVTISGWISGYGYAVYLSHDEGYETIYAHASKLLVDQGEEVVKGQILALSGSTGNTTGPCVHFEVRKDGKPMDPQHFVEY